MGIGHVRCLQKHMTTRYAKNDTTAHYALSTPYFTQYPLRLGFTFIVGLFTGLSISFAHFPSHFFPVPTTHHSIYVT
ncbi:uncharacterized protein G2W53_038354 [Senna tora]|uniref:Uncharacterized protein n=1 Tax=Senna tora TaxID=362788 RepID=A0A834W228_9FABA|nr:uncharacterized protein G2W53_038354 [Senna tora]